VYAISIEDRLTGCGVNMAHHWLTVDFTDETENGWQKNATSQAWSRFPKAINDTALGRRRSPAKLVSIPH
jgi:hypothetical protein